MSFKRNILIGIVLAALLAIALWFAADRSRQDKQAEDTGAPSIESPLPPDSPDTAHPTADPRSSTDTTESTNEPSALPGLPESIPTPHSFPQPSPGSSDRSLAIPVAGISPDQLQDTYNDERSEGRPHQALDIMAAQGTPVLAASDGRIVRFFQSERGGLTIYEQTADSLFILYYAHLDRYAVGVGDGDIVRRGQVIGYVGDTGNAGAGNFHLHFAIWRITDPKRYWDGENINPFPVLRGELTLLQAGERRTGVE